jgi:hypothetical protein
MAGDLGTGLVANGAGMACQMVELCLQDTTEPDFNGQQARGLGPLTYEARHVVPSDLRRHDVARTVGDSERVDVGE